MKLADLKPNEGQIEGVPSNPRTITEDDFEKLKKSLVNFRKMLSLRPMVVDEDWNILGGNMRYQALCRLRDEGVEGFTEDIPDEWVKQDTTLSAAEKREFVIKDNQQRGRNDWDALANEWDEEEHREWDVEAAEWSADSESEDDSKQVDEDDFDENKDAVQTVCKQGDIYQLGAHRLMCGDSTNADDVARLMDGEKAQLVITDPPYNVAIGSKNKALNEIQEANRIVDDIIADNGMTDEEIGEKIWAPAFKNLCDFATDDCAIYVSMPQGGTHMMMMMMMSRYWQVKHELIWLKNAPTFSMGRLNYDYKHEPIAYGWKKKHNWYAKEPKQSILCFDKPKKCDLHPTMKPVALWAELISNSSQDGMIVSDFFGGSGTTIIACEQLGRKARIMELDPHYCDVIIARWEKLTGEKAVLINRETNE